MYSLQIHVLLTNTNYHIYLKLVVNILTQGTEESNYLYS